MTSHAAGTRISPPRRVAFHVPSVPCLPGASAAVSSGDWVFTSGLLPADSAGRLDPSADIDPDHRFRADRLEWQSRLVMDTLTRVLRSAGCRSGKDVVRIWQWIPSRYPAAEGYREPSLTWPAFPAAGGYVRSATKTLDKVRASTGIGVRSLPAPGAAIGVEALAMRPGAGEKRGFGQSGTGRHLPFTGTAGVGDWVFIAAGASDLAGDWMSPAHMGPASLVAADARISPYGWLGSQAEAQTHWTLRRLAAQAALAGTSLERCVKADVTLGHPGDYLGFERAWRSWFPEAAPARTLVTGARFVVKGVRVEIGMTLLAADSAITPEIIEAGRCPPAIGHAPQAVRAGHLLFLSSLLPTGGGATRLQAEMLLERASEICGAAGSDLSQTCKVQVFYPAEDVLPSFTSAWQAAFPHSPPALSAVGIGGPDPMLVPAAGLQLDAIAHVQQRSH